MFFFCCFAIVFTQNITKLWHFKKSKFSRIIR